MGRDPFIEQPQVLHELGDRPPNQLRKMLTGLQRLAANRLGTQRQHHPEFARAAD